MYRQKMVEYSPMQNNRMVYVALGLVILVLGVGVTVRYEVLKGRNLVEAKPVTDFSSCIEAQGDLDVTGTICTSATGATFTKPGAPVATTTATEPPPTTSTTTTSTTTPLSIAPLTLGVATTFLIHDTKTFGTGMTMTLNAIADSRCKPGVQCIWAGEFSTTWTITTGTTSTNLSLGTVRAASVTEGNYIYTLTEANEDHAVLTITKAPLASGTGTVTGTVKVGPVCPVESVDHPCVVPTETYTSRSVVVYAADKTTELEQHPLDATGNFSFTLKPGAYGLQIRPAGIGAGEIKPVTISAKGTSTVTFDIDTGIR
jgi:hypothetical protein